MSTMSLDQTRISDEADRACPAPSDARRSSSAARTVFAERGYAASTDQVARAAGVSQPYVVRLFGTKRELFLEAYTARQARDPRRAAGGSRRSGRQERWATPTSGCSPTATCCGWSCTGSSPGPTRRSGRVARNTLGRGFRLLRERSGPTRRRRAGSSRRGCSSTCCSRSTRPRTGARTPVWTALVQCVQDGIAERRTA